MCIIDRIYTPDMVLGQARNGIKLTYCTDTRPVPSISEHAAGSDLLICEHKGGFLPFEVEITDKIADGDNLLTICLLYTSGILLTRRKEMDLGLH